MILLQLNDQSKTTLLIDCSLSSEAIAGHCDVAEELFSRLPRDSAKRPYVDAFILTHRHDDHIKGFSDNLHLGPVSDYKTPKDGERGKIIIRELWTNDFYNERESENYVLCEDAKAFNKEAKRRVKLYTENRKVQGVGDRVIIVGKRTEETEGITYEVGTTFTKFNEVELSSKLDGLLLGPLEQQTGEPDDDYQHMNRQSIIVRLTVKQGQYENQILLTGDAECFVWESLWGIYSKDASKLAYDILLAPHHCSWHSISYDSQSEDDDPQVSDDAVAALSQCTSTACIVSQSKPIKEKDSDPPSVAAKAIFVGLVGKDSFYCTDSYPNEDKPEPLEFNLTGDGPQKRSVREKSKISVAAISSTKEALPHG